MYPVCVSCPCSSEEWFGIPWTMDGCEPLRCFWGLNFSPLEEHHMLSSIVHRSSPIIKFFFKSWLSLNNTVFNLAVVADDVPDLLVLLSPLPQHSEYIPKAVDPQNWSYRELWFFKRILGIKSGSSGRAVIAFDSRVYSLLFFFLPLPTFLLPPYHLSLHQLYSSFSQTFC